MSTNCSPNTLLLLLTKFSKGKLDMLTLYALMDLFFLPWILFYVLKVH